MTGMPSWIAIGMGLSKPHKSTIGVASLLKGGRVDLYTGSAPASVNDDPTGIYLGSIGFGPVPGGTILVTGTIGYGRGRTIDDKSRWHLTVGTSSGDLRRASLDVVVDELITVVSSSALWNGTTYVFSIQTA